MFYVFFAYATRTQVGSGREASARTAELELWKQRRTFRPAERQGRLAGKHGFKSVNNDTMCYLTHTNHT